MANLGGQGHEYGSTAVHEAWHAGDTSMLVGLEEESVTERGGSVVPPSRCFEGRTRDLEAAGPEPLTLDTDLFAAQRDFKPTQLDRFKAKRYQVHGK